MFRKLSDRQVLWGGIALYTVVFGTLTALRHYHFATQAWDLGIFTQSFWNASHGRGLINTIEQVSNHLGVHFSPILFLLVPGYAFFQALFQEGGQYYLLIVQTLALALGAWPLFLLAKKILSERGIVSSFWPRWVVVAYLLYPPLHALQMYDFHEVAFFVSLFLFALYFLEKRNWLWSAVFLTLSALVKEDAILVVLFAGLFLLANRTASSLPPPSVSPHRKNIIAGSIVVLALIYFFLVIKVFMPAEGGGLFRIDRYANLGNTGTEIAGSIALNPLLLIQTVATPQKATYVFWLLLPLLFLPLLSWRALILLIPGLAENLLTNYSPQFGSEYHYDALLIPGLFLGAIYGAGFFLSRFPNREKQLRVLFLCAILLGFLVRSPLRPTAFPTDYFRTTPREEAYRNLVRLVPPEVSVSAHTNLVPHLANRAKIYFAGFEPELSDIALLNTEDLFGFASAEAMNIYITRYEKSGQYNLYVFDDRYVVLVNKKLKVVGLPAEAKQ
ncbi:MAG: DUF2079 domain-containing protein [bacterium]|nr:DUF2079 domain-containing protein [bacterium]